MDDHADERWIKRFTVEEANAMLPLLRSIVGDIRVIFTRVTGRRADLHRLIRQRTRKVKTAYDDEMQESRADLQAEYDKIWQLREELESLGVMLRQPEIGSIEFPAIVDGKDCYLCWELEEARVQYFRPLHADASEKRLLPELQNAN